MTSTCPRCAKPVECGARDAQCWCQTKKPLLSNFRNADAATLNCLCPACLDALLAQQAQQTPGAA